MNLSWGLLSKYRNELYGFSIIWIILFHGIILKKCALPKSLKILEDFLERGNLGVEIFLFLSGVCLYSSMKNDCNILNFYKKRLIRIFSSLFIICGTYWFYTCIIQGKNFIKFFYNITFYSFWSKYDGQVWFVALIIPLYFLYPYLYKYWLSLSKNKLLILFVMVFGIYALCFMYSQLDWKNYKGIEIALTRIPVFLVGCYCGEYVYEDKKLDKIFLIGLLISMLVGFILIKNYSLVKGLRFAYFLIGLGLQLLISIVLEFWNNKAINKQLSVCGRLSLELYLVHIIFRRFYTTSSLYDIGKVQNYGEYVLLCMIGAIVVSMLVCELKSTLKIS